MLKVPSHHYVRKIYDTILFRDLDGVWTPYRMGDIIEERNEFDYTATSRNLFSLEIENVDINDGSWHFGIPVELGNILSHRHKVCFFPRLAPRSSYRYGLNNRSVRFSDIHGNTTDPSIERDSLLRMLRDDYSDLNEAIHLLTVENYTSVPISKKLYLMNRGRTFDLKFKTIDIGIISNGSLYLTDERFSDLISDIAEYFITIDLK